MPSVFPDDFLNNSGHYFLLGVKNVPFVLYSMTGSVTAFVM